MSDTSDLCARASRFLISAPPGFDELLERAFARYEEQRGAIGDVLVRQLEILRRYDVPGMSRAANICFWGRSGSYLLGSNLDGHDDVVTLPMVGSRSIYPFFEDYPALSVWQRLIAYPAYSDLKAGLEGPFFEGEFAISAIAYYAAVHGLFAIYGERDDTWLTSRRGFFQMLHVAYAVALGQLPGSPHPLMVYAQHWPDDRRARQFSDDFPDGLFIHTVRDPLSSLNSWFERHLEMQRFSMGYHPERATSYLSPAVATIRDLLASDRPHLGMESRTCAVRFEDLHLRPEETMRRLASWLGITYRPCLTESTLNRMPYVVESGGRKWVGPNPSNAQRRAKNLNLIDRSMMYALFRADFIAWDYPMPKAFHRKWVCACVIALLLSVPWRLEIITARLVLKTQALPSLRSGRVRFACGAPFFLLGRRLYLILLIAARAPARLLGSRRTLMPL